jgi:serine protease AprX
VKSVTRLPAAHKPQMKKALDPPVDKMQPLALDTGFYGAAANQNTMIHINALHEKGYWGDSVIISIMDAGFDNVPANDFFAKVYAENRVLYTWDYVFDRSNVYLSDAHGAETFSDIAANIPHRMVGTAPNAEFLLFNTEDVRSETIVEEYNWVHAAEVADSLGAKVFSTSLGYTTFDASDSMDNTTYATLNGHSTPMAIAGNTAASKGILVVNSAGNEGAGSWHYISTPADADSVVAVGSVAYNGAISSFSGRGPNSSGMIKPNLCAQGQGAQVVFTNGVVGPNNGTSFSCPIMAGAFACLREAFPAAPNMVIVDAVQRSASYAGNPNNDYGYGIPDFGAAYDYLKVLYPADSAATRVMVYPNPFVSSFSLNVAYLLNGPINIELYDMAGRRIWFTSFAETTYPDNLLTITPPAIEPGSYILRINHSYAVRLVKKT